MSAFCCLPSMSINQLWAQGGGPRISAHDPILQTRRHTHTSIYIHIHTHKHKEEGWKGKRHVVKGGGTEGEMERHGTRAHVSSPVWSCRHSRPLYDPFTAVCSSTLHRILMPGFNRVMVAWEQALLHPRLSGSQAVRLTGQPRLMRLDAWLSITWG